MANHFPRGEISEKVRDRATDRQKDTEKKEQGGICIAILGTWSPNL